jgi:hypothetical protein
MFNDYDPEQNKREQTKMQEKAQSITKLIVGTFETQIGQRCIKHLKKTYVDRDMYVTGATLDMVAFRQGQANIVKQILKELEGSK